MKKGNFVGFVLILIFAFLVISCGDNSQPTHPKPSPAKPDGVEYFDDFSGKWSSDSFYVTKYSLSEGKYIQDSKTYYGNNAGISFYLKKSDGKFLLNVVYSCYIQGSPTPEMFSHLWTFSLKQNGTVVDNEEKFIGFWSVRNLGDFAGKPWFNDRKITVYDNNYTFSLVFGSIPGSGAEGMLTVVNLSDNSKTVYSPNIFLIEKENL